MILYLFLMFGATGRGDDIGVTTELSPPKKTIYNTIQSLTNSVWVNCALGNKCTDVTITNMQYIIL